MNSKLTSLAKRGSTDLTAQLLASGWSFDLGAANMAASAYTNCPTKQIVIHPRIALRIRRRDYKYVIPHEMGHALDCTYGWPSKFLPIFLPQGTTSATRFDYQETREILAERVAMIMARNDKQFLEWLKVSLNYHKKHHDQIYGIKQIKHPAVTELAYMLLGKSNGGTYFKHEGTLIVPAYK